MSSPPRVFLTGSEGLLGGNLRRELSGSFDIVAPAREEMDILRREETIARIVDARPNLVIHAAAYTAVDRAEEEPEAAEAVNVQGTRAVAEGALMCGACLIYISTDYVFNGRKGEPYLEEDETDPLNVYGRTKLEGERVVTEVLLHYLIVRTAWLFGPDGPNFVEGMARRARAGERVEVVDDQTGSPTYAPHLAKAMADLYKARVKGLINVVNSGSCSWYGLAREIYRLAGAPPELVVPVTSDRVPRPAARPSCSILDLDKYRRITGGDMPEWTEALKTYMGTLAPPDK